MYGAKEPSVLIVTVFVWNRDRFSTFWNKLWFVLIICASVRYFNSCYSSYLEKYVSINLIWGPSQIITQKAPWWSLVCKIYRVSHSWQIEFRRSFSMLWNRRSFWLYFDFRLNLNPVTLSTPVSLSVSLKLDERCGSCYLAHDGGFVRTAGYNNCHAQF